MRKIILLLALTLLVNCKMQSDCAIEKLKVITFKEGITNKEVQLIDVRTLEEYEEGAIEGASLIDFYSEDFEVNALKLDKNKPVYLYCKRGVRSWKAAKQLSNLGFKNIYDLKGGYDAWKLKNN